MEPQDQSPSPLTPRPPTPPPQPTSQPPAPPQPQPQPHPSSPPPVPTSTKPRTGTLTSAQKPPLPPIPQQQIAPPPQPSFLQHRPFSDPNRLAPEDAYYIPQSPPRIRTENHPSKVAAAKANGALISANGVAVGVPPVIPGLKPVLSLGRRRREKDRGSSGSRRQKGVWKKLLWVKQSYPDNYTDPDSFLDHLQRNPRLRPYDFWPLVADSTVIVQHVCSVAIFVCCFVGIFQERLSPVSVVGWGSFGTILGWGLWDNWVRKEEEEAAEDNMLPEDGGSSASSDLTSASLFNISAPALNGNGSAKEKDTIKENGSNKDAKGLGLTLSTSNLSAAARRYPPAHSYSASATSLQSVSANSAPSPLTPPPSYPPYPPRYTHFLFSPLTQSRLSTAKSATLIFLALLGLSPILKSLTKSTSSDSIWAMSGWLMGINLFFFDYGGEYAAASLSSDLKPRLKGKGKPGDAAAAKFPASLSTNAALMASTVLASRLRTSTHVFSLTLFSIEVFGLFPVFRRHLRHRSWRGHMFLSVFLVVAAGGGVGVTLAGKGKGGVGSAVVGALVGCGLVAVVMGGCSWWLIGLQKYKNVVIGPWDPARPVLKGRGVWD